jgi:DNA-binding MarR family transcriptional regulator
VPSVDLHRAPTIAAVLDQLGRRMRIRSESVLATKGLRPRHLVVLTVLRDNADLTQQGLAPILQIDSTNLVGLLNELEGSGLVERRRSAQDRRRHLVGLTKRGERRLADVEDALSSAEDDVLSALSTEERQTFYALLQLANNGHMLSCTADEQAQDSQNGDRPSAVGV